MRFAVTSSSFRTSRQQDSRRDLFWVIAQARDMGFEGIEFSDLLQDRPIERAMDLAARLREACRQAHLTVVCYGVGGEFINPPGEDIQQEPLNLRHQACVAQVLGSPILATRPAAACPRDDRAPGLPRRPARPARCCRVVTAHAETGRPHLRREPRLFIQESDRCEQLFRGQPSGTSAGN